MSSLRHIAVLVEEPRRGAFAWALIERSGADGEWHPLQRAAETTTTYRTAMADGLLALQQHVDDLDAGPRTDAPTARRAAPAQTAPSPSDKPAEPAKGAFFGFGPAR